MSDSYENFYGLNASSNDAALNYDDDALQNIDEAILDSDPYAGDTDHDGFYDDADSNVHSRAFVPLGIPFWTDTNNCFYSWPNWMLSSYKMDGSWSTNPPAWHVESTQSNNIGRLAFQIDRSVITNNLVLSLQLNDTPGSSLYVDLINTNGVVISTNIFGNILSGTDQDISINLNIPLTNTLAASQIELRRGMGEITVYHALLYSDSDLDRLDNDQEAQLGTDPLLSDTDSDGLSDYTEIFVTHTNPLLTDSDGDGLSDGDEVNLYGTDPLKYDTDGDGLSDGAEVNVYHTNPNTPDTDGDGLTDGAEVAFGRDPNLFDTYSYLVFQEQFETNTVALGDLNGQHNWTASITNTAIIQTNFVYDGSQSLLINNPDHSTTSVVSQIIVATNEPQVWFDMIVVPKAPPEQPTAPSGVAAIYFSHGRLVVFDGISQSWITLTNHPPVTADWARVTFMADFQTQRWLVCLDGTLLATEIGFASYTPYASMLSIVGNSGGADNITIGRDMPGDLDLDNDGLTATEELAAGSDPFSADSDGDGMGDAAELRWGFSPTQTNTYFRLDSNSGHDTWFTGFEPGEGYQTGNLNAQNGWLASSNVAVTASNAYSGIQSVTIPQSGTTNVLSMKGRFGTHGRDRIWISLYTQPVTSPANTKPDNSACAICVYDNRVHAYDGTLHAWVHSPKVFNIGTNQWVRIDILADFNTKKYLVCLNGILALEDVHFGDPTINELTALSVAGSDLAGGTWIDDIMLSIQEPAAALDFDNDGLFNADEYTAGTDPRNPDTDNDGITDSAEINIFNTDPLKADSDNDGMPDGWEIANSLDPLNNDAAADPDSDTLSNLQEYTHHTDPNNPDTDADTLTDATEVNTYHTDPTSADTDTDGLSDPEELAASTDPNNPDTDGDTLTDYAEVTIHHTNPTLWDSDGEGLSDAEELQIYLTSPTNIDTDADSILDATLIEEHNGADSFNRDHTHISSEWFDIGTSVAEWHGYLRPAISYAFNIQTAGIYRVGLQISNYLKQLPTDMNFAVDMRVNGYYAGRFNISANLNKSAKGFLPSLWMNPGQNIISLTWVGHQIADQNILIEKISLYAIDGLDSNTNGIQDWMENILASRGDSDGDTISDLDEVSIYHTSPVLKDTDNDGIDDNTEISLGFNPNSTDTDNDGISDADELEAGTDPTVAEFNTQQTVITQLNGAAFTNSTGFWLRENNAAICYDRGGSLQYELPVYTNGHFILNLAMHQNNTASTLPFFDISFAVDGTPVTRRSFTIDSSHSATANIFLPYLTQGNHSLTIKWNNPLANSNLAIDSIKLILPGGSDSDSNGVPDWLDSRLALALNIQTPTQSLVSPFCLEGNSREPDTISASCSYAPDGIPQNITIQQGPNHLWFANIDLSPTNTTTINLTADNQQRQISTNITWQTFNIFDPTNTTGTVIRANDSLLIGGFPQPQTNGTLSVDISLNTTTLTNITLTSPTSSASFQFTSSGQYSLSATWSNATNTITSTSAVEVISAHFASQPTLITGYRRNWDCPNLPADKTTVHYDATHIQLSKSPLSGGGTHFSLRSYFVNTYHLIARISSGSIIDSTTLRNLRFDTNKYRTIQVIQTYPDGSQLLEVELWLNEIPPDLRITLSIFAGGVLFDDGTTSRTVTAADFDALGRYRHRLIRPAGVTYSVCHRIKIYDANTKIAF